MVRSQQHFFAFEIGFDTTYGASYGINWVCFARVCEVVHFHNTLLKQNLCLFEPPANWV